ncbi:MAG TPA: hypothetical protein VFH61_00595 [Thermoleophilia bacterium]|nr:hypothetical protein [Thermoleophilia bacterium]
MTLRHGTTALLDRGDLARIDLLLDIGLTPLSVLVLLPALRGLALPLAVEALLRLLRSLTLNGGPVLGLLPLLLRRDLLLLPVGVGSLRLGRLLVRPAYLPGFLGPLLWSDGPIGVERCDHY